jgi:hypothetical protein
VKLEPDLLSPGVQTFETGLAAEVEPTQLPEIEFEPVVLIEPGAKPAPIEAAAPATALSAEQEELSIPPLVAAPVETESAPPAAEIELKPLSANWPAPELEPVVPIELPMEALPLQGAVPEAVTPVEPERPLAVAALFEVESSLPSPLGPEVELKTVSLDVPAPELEPAVSIKLPGEALPLEAAAREPAAPAEAEIPLIVAAPLEVELPLAPVFEPEIEFKTAPAPELEPTVSIEVPAAPEPVAALEIETTADTGAAAAVALAPLEPEPAPAVSPETEIEFAPVLTPPAAPEPERAAETPPAPAELPPEAGLARLALADLEVELEAEPLPEPLAEPFAAVGGAGSDVVLRFFADLQNENPGEATALYGTEFAHVNADRVEHDRAGVRRFYWQMLRRLKARRLVILSLSGQRTAIRARWATQTLSGAPVQGTDTFHLNRRGQILYHHTSFRLE